MRLYQRNSRWPRTLFLSALGLALIVLLSVSLLNQAEERVQGEQQAILESALRRASVTCYALEGRYPATLDYLIEHYGVVIDEGRFVVFYNVFARNVMPDIQVNPIGSGHGIPALGVEMDYFDIDYFDMDFEADFIEAGFFEALEVEDIEDAV
ncbi:MAG: hypothetical protein FWE77_03125 [Clostridia bacterium]|nr:hypothetical protein [Clostridia bacterium]